MFKIHNSYFTLALIIFLSGCVKQDDIPENKVVYIEETPKVKKEIVQKKVIKKKVKKKVKKIQKKKIIYKYCNKHLKIMKHASQYISNEFEKGYFQEKDFVGAKAQVFLIENKSPNIFAKNINNALDSYKKQYAIAKKNKCNIKKYKTSPLSKIKYKIKQSEKIKKDKNETK